LAVAAFGERLFEFETNLRQERQRQGIADAKVPVVCKVANRVLIRKRPGKVATKKAGILCRPCWRIVTARTAGFAADAAIDYGPGPPPAASAGTNP
jgi:hypothetical protein